MKREHDIKWEQGACRVEVKSRQGENLWLRAKGCVHCTCFAYAQDVTAEIPNLFMTNTHQISLTVFTPLWTKAFIQLVYYFYFFPFAICFHTKSSQQCQCCGTPISQFTLPTAGISMWPQVQFWYSEATQCSFLLLSFGIISLKSPILPKSNKAAECWFESFVSCLSQMVN